VFSANRSVCFLSIYHTIVNSSGCAFWRKEFLWSCLLYVYLPSDCPLAIHDRAMSFWRGTCQHVRRASSREALCWRRPSSHSIVQRAAFCANIQRCPPARERLTLFGTRVRRHDQLQSFVRVRRRPFSTTAKSAHGHITPPKPGEE
jgi:hypothetical protein